MQFHTMLTLNAKLAKKANDLIPLSTRQICLEVQIFIQELWCDFSY